MGDAGNDKLYGGTGNDLLDGGAGKDIYGYLSTMLGSGDLAGGYSDTLKVTIGDKISFASGAWSALKSGAGLDSLNGQKLGSVIDASHNVAQVGKVIQIDTSGDGHFDGGVDFSIQLVGTFKQVAIDAGLDGFVIK